jgi:hypothetical protein
MRLHPAVQRIVAEAVGESKVPVKVYAPNPTSAKGFFPDRLHPNLSIDFKPVGGGKHIELAVGRTTHVQYSGDHFGGTPNQAEYAAKKRCLIISAIGWNQGGRYAAVALDYAAQNGGKLLGEAYFSWQGMRSGVGETKAIEIFFSKMNTLFGLTGQRVPNEKQDAKLFAAAGLKVEQEAAEAVPEFIKDSPDLLPAVKVLKSIGANLETDPGIPIELKDIPADLAHQHILQKALDDLKDASIIDYDVAYDKSGKIIGITIMREGVDSDNKDAIIESMSKLPADIRAKPRVTAFGVGYEITCDGVTFLTTENVDGGSIAILDGKVDRGVCEYEKGKLAKTIRTLAAEVKSKGINETIKARFAMING